MDFHLSKEQEMIRKMYREFAETEVKPLAEELDEEEPLPEAVPLTCSSSFTVSVKSSPTRCDASRTFNSHSWL